MTSKGNVRKSEVSTQKLQLAGAPINNSRNIESLITFANSNRARTFYAFLEYVSVIRTFIDNVSVAI